MAPLIFKRFGIDPANTTSRSGPALLNVWIYFNLIVNTILLPILTLTFLLSRRAKRHPTLVNVCLTWVFGGQFALLLFYAGEHVGPEPHTPICVAQSSLLYGITPMWSVSVLMLLYYALLCVKGKQASLGFWTLVFMLASPYITQIAFSIAALFVTWHNLDLLSRRHRFFYCAVDYLPLGWAMSLFTAIICLFIVLVLCYLVFLVYRNWKQTRVENGRFNEKLGNEKGPGGQQSGRRLTPQLEHLARVLAFGMYITFGAIINFVSMFAPPNAAPDIYAATAGTAIFLIFGTQPDVLRVWLDLLIYPLPASLQTTLRARIKLLRDPARAPVPIPTWGPGAGSAIESGPPAYMTDPAVLSEKSNDEAAAMVGWGLGGSRTAEVDLLGSASPTRVARAFKDLPPLPQPQEKPGYLGKWGAALSPRKSGSSGSRANVGGGRRYTRLGDANANGAGERTRREEASGAGAGVNVGARGGSRSRSQEPRSVIRPGLARAGWGSMDSALPRLQPARRVVQPPTRTEVRRPPPLRLK